MTINEFTSGVNTTFSNELNENFKKVSVKQSQSQIYSTEYSTSVGGESWTDLGFSKTFTPPSSDHIIYFLKIDADFKNNNGEDYHVRAILENNNNDKTVLANKLGEQRDVTNGGTDSIFPVMLQQERNSSYNTFTNYVGLNNFVTKSPSNLNTVYGTVARNFEVGIQEGPYTLKFEARTRNYNPSPSETVFVKNVQATVAWEELIPPEQEGWN